MAQAHSTSHSFTERKRIRKDFGHLRTTAKMPNLIEIQKNSYEQFLQIDTPSDQREERGLEAVFKSVFPIEDHSGAATLEYVKYDFDPPKYDVDECVQRDLTFSAPIRVTMRLIVWDVNEEAGTRDIQGIKEQDVYLGDIPLMTENGTFVVNGTERVIVSQMHRSPGVFYDHDHGKSHSSGKVLFSARVIPYRGSWLDFEFDPKDQLHFRIDRRRKLHINSLLRALGFSAKEIIETYYTTTKINYGKKGWSAAFKPENYFGVTLVRDLINAKTGKPAATAGTKLTPRKARKLGEEGLEQVLLSEEDFNLIYLGEEVVDKATGEIIAGAGSALSPDIIDQIEKSGLKELTIVDAGNNIPYILQSMNIDKNTTQMDALIDIYKVMRPGEPPTEEAAEAIFNGLFFDPARYDLSDVGRMKISTRLGKDVDEWQRVLTREDIVDMIRMLIDIKEGRGEVDDIDHLGNRRVRSVGELMENQFRIGLLRMERAILERMSAVEIDTVMPHDFINAKPLAAVVKEFFGSSQLSQFMDQTNPLSEVTHKRRLSALGPGGLTRERAGFEVRDVHPTHYGRICPIETPEGPNIGLINSLSTYARINKYGFIETPYRKVVDGKITEEIEYLSAIEESKYTIAQSDAPIDKNRKFTEELVSCRVKGDFTMSRPEDVDYADVSPKQLVSVAASLIPFLENDDANRALMGSNMMRQAVPVLRSEAPLVGTGMEGSVASDSGAVIKAVRDGVVDQVDGKRIVVKVKSGKKTEGVDIYRLKKFQRSNQNTCMNQKPIVKVGDAVKAGDVIADGPSTNLGELALGRNVTVAFMPWNGYNFEDSILISERIVQDDVFTSVHIEEFQTMARDTKLGPEEITRDIPNVGEEALRQLDETGIVHIGAEVGPGDILVGKVTPKSESPMTPEEKLLRAIFGEKAADVRDSSLKMKPGISGRVVEVRIFSRRGIEKDERAMAIEHEEIERLSKDRHDELTILAGHIFENLESTISGKELTKVYEGQKKGSQITKEFLQEMPKSKWWQMPAKLEKKELDAIEKLKEEYDALVRHLDARMNDKIEKLQGGDDLPSGVLKMVKVFVAVKRKLQPGDKMAGRHGNKGVISKICPLEDMPFTADGRPVDIVLNPLGVPSRMNVGQILETHLGWASKNFGRQVAKLLETYTKAGEKDLRAALKKVYTDKDDQKLIDEIDSDGLLEMARNVENGIPMATPVFDGADVEEINEHLEQSGCERKGQTTLYDGRTGERFDRDVTVGIIYMLKLHHLVDDKIHARSIGPYSLVTQQPLGGKSHFGGQRFGEMECWALQAYGAAYTLQELLTVKSDDVAGRTKVYESIVKGDHTFESGIPESFNVIVKELRSLCLNVELRQKASNE